MNKPAFQPKYLTIITGLKVTFPDGNVIQERFAYQTLLETIRIIGHERIKLLNLSANHVPLVSSVQDDYYKQHMLYENVLIMTQTSTKVKKAHIEEISKFFDLGLKVEII